ncbi:MAG TPA: pyridoxamine 5'-phosphate oxidase family protein [Solirubrobacteraceae bacterium]|nr:pyridoxamine 5'-phosphate oxidase family protein [Solirubrobacteraceae bacterium]
MGVLSARLEEFLDSQIVGVIATDAGDTPLQSVVYYVREGERLMVSSTTARRKVKDVERTGWASLCVMGFERPFPSATFSGPATILTTDIGRPTAAITQRFMGGDELPEIQTDEALAGVGRVIIAITVERVAAASWLD